MLRIFLAATAEAFLSLAPPKVRQMPRIVADSVLRCFDLGSHARCERRPQLF